MIAGASAVLKSVEEASLPSRREFLKSAGALAGVTGLAAPTPKPNVIFVLAGGWRAATLDDMRAPNLQALARQGMLFERLYTCCPLAGPSRAALITGKFPRAGGVPRDNVRLPIDQPSIAEQLSRAIPDRIYRRVVF